MIGPAGEQDALVCPSVRSPSSAEDAASEERTARHKRQPP